MWVFSELETINQLMDECVGKIWLVSLLFRSHESDVNSKHSLDKPVFFSKTQLLFDLLTEYQDNHL